MKLAGLLLVLAAVACRAAPVDPTIALCSVFWGCLICGNAFSGNLLFLPGMTCNAAAMIANGGVMPVYGQEGPFTGWHVQGTEDMALQFLCDNVLGSSVGDFLLGLGLIAMLAVKRPWRRRGLQNVHG